MAQVVEYIPAPDNSDEAPSVRLSDSRSEPTTGQDRLPREAGYEDLVKLMQKQADLTERLVAKAEKNGAVPPLMDNGISQEILEILRKMHEKQVSSDVSKQPIPSAPATSAAAWSPLLRSHLDRIQPTVDRWRGTLDTILVFVALFSAIITTFFVQSLDGLTQDPSDRTNELLQNLTELVIAVSGVNASHLRIPSPMPFEPEGDVVRLNFYWSLSLVLSISVAVLAVTSRGYVAMLTRSRHSQAHKKLGDLHRRWLQANRLLSPSVEFLPQLLILPIVLFIVGLLDNIISSSLPLSGPFAPIFIAGLLSAIFAISVATYTIWTVFHGWFYPDVSPFQSTISQLWILHGPSITHRAEHISRSVLHYYQFWKTRFAAFRASSSIQTTPSFDMFCAESSDVRQLDASSENAAPPDAALEPHDAEAFHATLQVTHDADVIDQAVSAYSSLISECAFRFKAKGTRRDRHFSLSYSGMSPMAYEIESLAFMLSDEANIRTNITAAAIIADPLISGTLPKYINPTLVYSNSDAVYILQLLTRASERYSLSMTGQMRSHVLWDSPFTKAMGELVSSIASSMDFSVDLRKAFPVLWLLLLDIPEKEARGSSQEVFTRTIFRKFLWDILDSTVHRQMQSPFDLEESFERLLEPNAVPQIWSSLRFLGPAQISSFKESLADIMTSGLSPYEFTLGFPYIAEPLLQWLFRPRQRRSDCLSFSHVSRGFPRAIEKLRTHFLWENERPTTVVPIRASISLKNFDWLLFILKETNHILASENDTVTEQHGQLLEHIETCITTLQLLQAFDDSTETALYSHAEHGLSDSSFAHTFAPQKVCISFCMFRAEMMQSAKLVRRRAPSIRLDTASWQRLIQALTAPDSDARFENPWRQYTPNTSRRHQEHVKQDILEAFEWLSPEPLASGSSGVDPSSHDQGIVATEGRLEE